MLSLQRNTGAQPERGWWVNEPASNRKALGIVLHHIGGNWTVARTLIGSPAAKAGVTVGEHFLAVDGYDVGASGTEMYEFQTLMHMDTSGTHRVTFRSSTGHIDREIGKVHLHQLLEFDYDNGGAALSTCVGCRTCRPVTIGATDCSSGCPGNYCTVA